MDGVDTLDLGYFPRKPIACMHSSIYFHPDTGQSEIFSGEKN